MHYQSCLTFPIGSAQTQSKHHSMRGCKGMTTPCLHSVAGKWELLFLVLQAFGCLIGMPILSHIPKTGYKFLVLSNLKINPCSKAI